MYLGKDISGSYDSGTMQPVFSITAKYANAEDKDRFVRVIREELERIVAEGLDQKSLMAGINSSEFRFREADFGSFPKGLMYGIDMMDTWLYDDNCPFGYLKQLAVFDFLKKQVGTGYYEDLIRDGLLNNPHTSLVVIEPKKGLNDRMEEELAKKLAAYKESLTEEERQALVEKTESLHRFQETPSTKEELEAIPMLKREDIGKEAYTVSNLEEQAEGTTFVRHDYVTNGVCYLDLLFDMKYVPAEYIPYAGLLKSVLGFIDTENYKYGELFSEINIETGGCRDGPPRRVRRPCGKTFRQKQDGECAGPHSRGERTPGLPAEAPRRKRKNGPPGSPGGPLLNRPASYSHSHRTDR